MFDRSKTANMKLALASVLVLGLAACVFSEQHYGKSKVVDRAFLEKQQKVLTLFHHINQPSYYEEHVRISKEFHPYKESSYFLKPEVAEHYFNLLENEAYLPRDDIFSMANEQHLKEAIALFKVLYYAKDFDTFYKTAVVAREHVNQGLFLYSVSVAIVHRKDTYGIILPPIYEVYPHYFFPTEVIHEAYKYKQMYEGEELPSEHGYTINSNYSGYYLNLHPEQSMSYYLEDIGINSFGYYYYIHYPGWMDGKEFGLENDWRGELFYAVLRQLTVRYYLERLSNHKGDIPLLDWNTPIVTPYYPSLEYPNGLEFPERPRFADLRTFFYTYGQRVKTKYGLSFEYVKDYERRINDVIDSGFIMTPEGKMINIYNDEDGLNLLSNIITGNADSPNPRYIGPYIMYASHVLGYSYQPLNSHMVVPSAMEHVETFLRDPVSYQFLKKLVLKFQRYLNKLPPYTEKDLVFEGVEVKKFEIERLITYFDRFYSELSNAVFDSEKELKNDKFVVRASQYRLNNKPFTYKIHVQSDKDQKATVKVFLGPKYDEFGRIMNISENFLNFFMMDAFVYDLKAGMNVMKRNSYESILFGPDKTSYRDLHKKVDEALKSQKEFHVDGMDGYFHFPRRFMLPKGSYDGLPYQFYVIVYEHVPYHSEAAEENIYNYARPGTGGAYLEDKFSVFYPFDRPIVIEKMFNEVPNSIFQEAKIYHRNEEDINATQG